VTCYPKRVEWLSSMKHTDGRKASFFFSSNWPARDYKASHCQWNLRHTIITISISYAAFLLWTLKKTNSFLSTQNHLSPSTTKLIPFTGNCTPSPLLLQRNTPLPTALHTAVTVVGAGLQLKQTKRLSGVSLPARDMSWNSMGPLQASTLFSSSHTAKLLSLPIRLYTDKLCSQFTHNEIDTLLSVETPAAPKLVNCV
jgi:hypothetical protein